ncbi:12247_t:CDS:2, partial [Funneliformis geosporum]
AGGKLVELKINQLDLEGKLFSTKTRPQTTSDNSTLFFTVAVISVIFILLLDCEGLGDNLDALNLAIESLKNSLTGKLKLANYLKEIGEKIYEFLKEYDKNRDGRIDVPELKIDKFA